jgi:glycosyltransferase involved in cell wall biosynthesis
MITVLMPVYNAASDLRRAIESILGQSYADFEFLIIDDGSIDQSVEIVESYSDRRIRLFRNEKNLGLSPTLNKGLELAGGELVARMDADDFSYPDRLARQMDYLNAHPDCALVGTGARVLDEGGAVRDGFDFRSESVYFNLTFGCWIFHPTVMFRKEAVLEVGGYAAFYGEDFTLWSRLSRRRRLHVLPEVLVDYRTSSQSLCNARKAEYEAAARAQVMENLQHFLGRDYTIPESWIDCYRGNYAPVLAPGDIEEVARCIQELDRILAAILRTPNPNRDEAAIRRAAVKRRFGTLTDLLRILSPSRRLELLVRLKDFRHPVRVARRVLRSGLRGSISATR